MTTVAIKNIETLLVDKAGAQIPYETATLRLNGISTNRIVNRTPISEMKHGKFRKLFDRHRRALV